MHKLGVQRVKSRGQMRSLCPALPCSALLCSSRHLTHPTICRLPKLSVQHRTPCGGVSDDARQNRDSENAAERRTTLRVSHRTPCGGIMSAV